MFHREYTTLHETGHYYQMINIGWASVLSSSLFSGNYNMPGNVEYGAQLIALGYGYYWR
ncbi:MAG: hypothetical protein HND40_08260 [Ignavibacteriota bacterium]|nr:hypothetical protein [Ignavibacterium album]MCZ2269382.1 hypothetical protein [Ignavibacteriales bacterium]QKJ99546.1 MAG: hypothetical protein HND40_08260 [Ignavibacteriota bacterium]HOJ08628.1 hypothetical protein [Ignavibacteriaceae bacterium]